MEKDLRREEDEHTLLMGLALGVLIVAIVSLSFYAPVSATEYTKYQNVDSNAWTGLWVASLWHTIHWTADGSRVTCTWIPDYGASSAWYLMWTVSAVRVDYANTAIDGSFGVAQSSADYLHYIGIWPFCYPYQHLHMYIGARVNQYGYVDNLWQGGSL